MINPPSADTVKYISSESIRKRFNKSQVSRMIEEGRLIPEYLRNDHLTEPEKVNEPQCTHGQMIRYYNTRGRWVVEVFQYLREDGTLGASGKPDPKRLRYRNSIFAVERRSPS